MPWVGALRHENSSIWKIISKKVQTCSGKTVRHFRCLYFLPSNVQVQQDLTAPCGQYSERNSGPWLPVSHADLIVLFHFFAAIASDFTYSYCISRLSSPNSVFPFTQRTPPFIASNAPSDRCHARKKLIVPTKAMPSYCGATLLYTLILCLGSVTFGFVLAFPSPSTPEMRKEFTGVSDQSFTLYNSISSLVAIFGPFLVNLLFAPPLLCGRRLACFVFAVTGAGFWLLLLPTTASTFWIAIVARALLGITLGAFSALPPMYVVEISPPALTGFYGSFPQLFIATGVTVCYLVGT
jgi:hypothetical protein